MDKRQISDALDIHPYGAYTITNLHIVNWGRDLVFECVYDPSGPTKPVAFQLIFSDCRELRWRAYAHLDVDASDSRPGLQPVTNLVDIRFGRDQHRSPTQILTDHFGVSLYSGGLFVKAGDHPPVSMSR